MIALFAFIQICILYIGVQAIKISEMQEVQHCFPGYNDESDGVLYCFHFCILLLLPACGNRKRYESCLLDDMYGNILLFNDDAYQFI